MRFLFLYTELAEYFIACCRELSKHGDVHIVRWPVNKEAPFRFEFGDIKVYDKADYTEKGLADLIASIDPSVIVCSGWIDRMYLRLVKPYHGKIPTVMTCDTHWRGDLKQRFATLAGKWYLGRIFSHAWVPGQIQKAYVLRLGFKPGHVLMGFYSCDLPYFEQVYREQFAAKAAAFPKRFLYVGRYYEFKGVRELWEAFVDLQRESPSDWELWCLGVGDIEPVKHEKIRHLGFVQPAELKSITAETGVFILPSRFEPWAVVVHEFAASGFPLLLSNQVGAREQFLKEGQNGYTFAAGNAADIKQALKKIISLPEDEWIRMGELSHALSESLSPAVWTKSLLHIL